MTLPHIPITPIPDTEPEAVPSLWNTRYVEIDENFASLDGRTTAIEGEVADARAGRPTLGQAITDIMTSLGLLGDTLTGMASPVSVQKAVELDWLYRNRRIAFELFADGYRLRNIAAVAVVSGVMGDDSIDVADTTPFRVGQDYLLVEGSDIAMVRVSAVLSGARLRLTTALTRNWSSAAVMTGQTFTARTGGGVIAPVGSRWISKPVNLGDDNTPRAVVIRRRHDGAEVRLYYRDGITATDWTERAWSVRRIGAPDAANGIPAGYADYEYLVPMRGEGYLRLAVDGMDTEIIHLVALGSSTELGGLPNPASAPTAPAIGSPADGAIDIGETPTVSIAAYISPVGNAFEAADFQIATDAAFTSIKWDSGWVMAQSASVPAGILQVGTTYYVRAMVRDAAGLVSAWGAASSFTTKTSYAYVNTPAITSPVNGSVDIPEQPTLYSSPFSTTGGADTHAASQWQIRMASDTWTAPLHDSGESTTDLTQYTVPAGILQPGQTQYVMRVRHKGAALGYSEWSPDITVTTKAQFASIIGLVQVATGGGAGQYQRIDENFAAATRDAAWFNNHPTYAGIVEQVIDGQSMIKIPKFWFKAGTVPSGAYAGKAYWMISDQPVSGFAVHPAFIGSGGVELDQIWVGKYQGSSASGKLQSIAGVLPRVSMNFDTARTEAYARNASGVSGFRLWSVYDLAAIQMLATIEIGGLDTQSLIGMGHVSGSAALSVSDATVAQATWRGIVGLWGNVWQMTDGLKRNGGTWHRWQYNAPGSSAPSDYATGYVNTNVLAPTSGGYPVTFDVSLLQSGLILPATLDSTSTNGSTGDYFYSNTTTTDTILYSGGHWGGGANAGLFFAYAHDAPSDSSSGIGCRLAKA